MKSIILIAAPAAGKGTEANLLKKEYNIPHISTGDLLRTATEQNNARAQEIKNLISDGKFVSDEIVIELLKERLQKSDCLNGYILDGFPRNIYQAEEYKLMLQELNQELGIVIVLDVDKEIAKKRISGRLTCPNCGAVYNIDNQNMKPIVENVCDKCNTFLKKRSDDNIETYEERYNSYLLKTEPLIHYYEDYNIVYHVNANISLNETHEQVKEIIRRAND